MEFWKCRGIRVLVAWDFLAGGFEGSIAGIRHAGGSRTRFVNAGDPTGAMRDTQWGAEGTKYP